ncbi:MAG: RdgB/HAM1 family non-canonical purine NTP pyrophosphatase [Spartobacteria bacterium]|nr:RdgB/HAM1 family non-canonical purine NTP pyrophosphatase [Spartobacteria bacterium]
MNLIFATKNSQKVREFAEILGLPEDKLCSALDYPELPDVEEDGVTFEENSQKKAVETAKATGCMALADDSGLVVEALDGQPGIYSARFAGLPVNHYANINKLLHMMDGMTDRRAYFICVMSLAQPDGSCQSVEGRCYGVIAPARRGDQGFGYDPVFIPDGYEQTFGELDRRIKNQLSHRGRAMQQACKEWGRILQSL